MVDVLGVLASLVIYHRMRFSLFVSCLKMVLVYTLVLVYREGYCD